MSTNRQKLGWWGETLAAEFLAGKGYKILERNARTPFGEIDIIACQEGNWPYDQGRPAAVTVFVEVKTRATRTFGFPEESITARKRQHMLSAAQSYMQAHPDLGEDWRIDVIAIEVRPSRSSPTIVHFENALLD